MRITTVSRFACLTMVVLTLVTLGCQWAVTRSLEQERHAVARQREFGELGVALARASDFLTDKVRLYSVTGDEREMRAYWTEVRETGTRDRVMARLREMNTPSSLFVLLEEAKANSDSLIPYEEAAMKAVEAGEWEKARLLVFGDDYRRNKQRIMEPIARFQADVNAMAEMETSGASAYAATILLVSQMMLVLMTVLGIGWIYFFFGRCVVRPITELSEKVSRLAAQDYSVALPVAVHKNEIGDLIEAVHVFKQNALEKQRMEEERALQKRQAEEERRAVLYQMADNFEASVRSLVDTVVSSSGVMEATAEQMADMTQGVTQRTDDTVGVVDQASESVQTVAATTEQLSDSIREISQRVSQSSRMTAEAVSQAEHTDRVVRSLSESAQKIGEIVSLITDIATQTNLLALNATIEAARAGESGRGFAVVAGEVKNLASQTAKATDEVSHQIGAIQLTTRQAVEAIQEIARTIGTIDETTTAIAAAVEEQSAATQGIVFNVERATDGALSVTKNIDEISLIVHETRQASSEVLKTALMLSEQADSLSREVDGFIDRVRKS